MIPEVSAIILAGGLGSRMGQITQDLPKSMLQVEGRPIISHILDGLQTQFGQARIIIATGYRNETIRNTYGNQYGQLSIEYQHSPEHLEIRKRLLLADGLIEGPFFVIGSDVLADPTHYLTMAEALDTKDSEILGIISGAVNLEPAPSHALISAKDDVITAINTNPASINNRRGDTLRDMSLWLFDQRTLDLLKQAPQAEINISPVLDKAIKGGVKYTVARYFGHWYHFGVPADLNIGSLNYSAN